MKGPGRYSDKGNWVGHVQEFGFSAIRSYFRDVAPEINN